MPIITDILTSAKPGRFVVMIDGAAGPTVSLEIVERLRLGRGTVWESVAAEVEREAAALATYDRALNMLAARGRSRADLRRHLVRKGEPAPQVDAAIERLTAAGLLDDAAYARQLARSKVLGAGLAKRRLRQELWKRGVSGDTADEAINEVLEDEHVDTEAIADTVARKKLRSLGRLDPATRRRRLYAFLARRGYDADEIRATMRRVLDDGDAADPDQRDGGERADGDEAPG